MVCIRLQKRVLYSFGFSGILFFLAASHAAPVAGTDAPRLLLPGIERSGIKIDGRLSDWGDLRQDAVVLHQQLDYAYGPPRNERPDAALFKMAHDDAGLYLAVRVSDASIVRPTGLFRRAPGDSLTVSLGFLSEPEHAEEPRAMGGSLPAIEFRIAPFFDSAGQVAWHALYGRLRTPNGVQARGRVLAGGYEFEMRIPADDIIAALPKGSGRLRVTPTLVVEDIDVEDSPTESTEPSRYQWPIIPYELCDTGLRAEVAHSRPAPLEKPYLRLAPAHNCGGKNDLPVKLVTGVVVTGWRVRAAEGLGFTCRFEATDYDRVPGVDAPTEPKIGPASPVVTDTYPALGISVHRRVLEIDRLAAGRYYLDTSLEDPRVTPLSAHYYAGSHTFNSDDSFVNTVLRDADPVAGPERVDLSMQKYPSYVDPVLHYAIGCESVKAWAMLLAAPSFWFALSEQAVQSGSKSVMQRVARYVALVDVSGKPMWEQDVALGPSGTPIDIPIQGIPAGRYTVETASKRPEGDRPWAGKAFGPSLVVMPPRDIVLKTAVCDAPVLLSRAEPVGNPARGQFPRDDMRDCQARSTHDLALYEGRIYIGYGDLVENRGPIQIWSFAPRASGPIDFTPEFTVDEESVDRFRTCGGRLIVPGIDSCDREINQWKLGNLYIKSAGAWRKLRTIPNAIHVNDVVEYEGRLFAAISSDNGGPLLLSEDDGQSWHPCSNVPHYITFDEMAPIQGSLLLASSEDQVKAFLCTNGEIRERFIPLLPDLQSGERVHVAQLTPFGAGVVYTINSWGNNPTSPLYYLDNLEQGAVCVEAFRNVCVRDIVARDGICHVLTAAHQKGEIDCRGEIYVSTNLREWTRQAAFTVPAIPNALEVADGRYYVGLANSLPWKSADAASGTICMILPPESRTDP
jgi:hypothetical protein